MTNIRIPLLTNSLVDLFTTAKYCVFNPATLQVEFQDLPANLPSGNSAGQVPYWNGTSYVLTAAISANKQVLIHDSAASIVKWQDIAVGTVVGQFAVWDSVNKQVKYTTFLTINATNDFTFTGRNFTANGTGTAAVTGTSVQLSTLLSNDRLVLNTAGFSVTNNNIVNIFLNTVTNLISFANNTIEFFGIGATNTPKLTQSGNYLQLSNNAVAAQFVPTSDGLGGLFVASGNYINLNINGTVYKVEIGV